MQLFLFVIGQILCLAFLMYLPFYCAKKDAKEFTDNPAEDTYGSKFHKQRFRWRVAAGVVVVLICSLPLYPSVLWLAIGALGLGAIGAGWFFYTFNPELSTRRKLDYVDTYYISFSETTAYFPDKWIASWAMKKYPGEPDAQRAAVWRIMAADKLKELMNLFLWIGIGIYSLSLTALLIHLL